VKRLTTNQIWSAFALAMVMIVAAPSIMVSQSGRANEPWNDPWSGPWPALLAPPNAIDPQVAALQQRIDASLERLMKASGEAAPPSTAQADPDAIPHWFPSQIAGREPGREP
jgi:hypothetical protein